MKAQFGNRGWFAELREHSYAVRELNKAGYPHTVESRVQERYTRLDHNDLQLTITVDDPKLYTKPFVLASIGFKWLPDQNLGEQLCIPSQVMEYLRIIGDPAK